MLQYCLYLNVYHRILLLGVFKVLKVAIGWCTVIKLCVHPCFRSPFGRGAGGMAKSFDARQKIGANDVRQRVGGGLGKFVS